MDRIKGGWLLLAASVLGLLLMTGALFPARHLSEYSVSAQDWEQLCAKRTPTEDALLTELTFNQYALWEDAATGRYFYSLIEKDPQAFDPPVTWRAAHGGVRLAVQEAALTTDRIAAGEPLHVMAYDDTQYHVYEVACTTLPLLSVNFRYTQTPIDEEKWQGEGSDFVLFDNRAQATQRVLQTVSAVRLRGGTTRAFPKQGYRMTLLEKSLGENIREYRSSLLGMRQDDDWLLYAGYNDQEKIRNVFCCNLWMDSCADDNGYGITGGMEYRYVELFWQGNYWGLYALGFPIDARQMELKQDMNGNDTEFLFKINQTFLSRETSSLEEIIHSQYEIKFTAQEPVQEKAWDLLVDYYQQMESCPDTAQIRRMNDMANAIDVYLFLNLVQGIDNDEKNMYITLKESGGTWQALYTPWDMDYTWGNKYSTLSEKNLTEMYGMKEDEDLIFPNAVPRLQELGDGQINAQVKQRYTELRQGAWSEEALNAMLGELEQEIFASGAFVRDRQRWPQGSYVNTEQGLSTFKDYVAKRLRCMDAFVAALP